MNPLVHYGLYGWAEGRKPHLLFDPQWYLAHYPDVARSGIEPLAHYLNIGSQEGRRPTFWFDEEEYLEKFPELIGSEVIPFVHFVEGCSNIFEFYNEEIRGKISANTAIQSLFQDDFLRSRYPKHPPLHLLDEKNAAKAIRDLLTQENAHIAISHDNYLSVTGGVQNCVSDQQSAFSLYPLHLRSDR